MKRNFNSTNLKKNYNKLKITVKIFVHFVRFSTFEHCFKLLNCSSNYGRKDGHEASRPYSGNKSLWTFTANNNCSISSSNDNSGIDGAPNTIYWIVKKHLVNYYSISNILIIFSNLKIEFTYRSAQNWVISVHSPQNLYNFALDLNWLMNGAFDFISIW